MSALRGRDQNVRIMSNTFWIRARRGAWAGTCLLGAVLAGCATPAPRKALAPVQAAAPLSQPVDWSESAESQARRHARVSILLSQPLTADGAVELALLQQPALQARLHALQVADAERAQALTPANPRIEFARLHQGGALERDAGAFFGLGQWLTLPWLRQIEDAHLATAQREVTQDMLATALTARAAWVEAVAAQASVAYGEQVRRAAAAAATLAQRMAQAGNFSPLERAREQAFLAEAELSLARTTLGRDRALRRLQRAVGWQAPQPPLSLPPHLPELPPQAPDTSETLQRAMAQRVDVVQARAAVEQQALALGLTRPMGWVDGLEFGLERNTYSHEPVQAGVSLGLEIPIFDWGSARVARAQALYRQRVAESAQVVLDARLQVQDATETAAAAYAVARRYRDDWVPAARRISEENLLRYNGMLISVFDLLADARAQIGTVQASQTALRDYWLAQAALDLSMLGRVPTDGIARLDAEAAAPSTAGPGATAAH